MSPAGRVVLTAALVAAAPAVGAGQVVQLTPVDTVLGLVPGDSATLQLQIVNLPSGGLSRYGITIFFDETRVQILRADPVLSPAPTVTMPAADQVHLGWSGNLPTSFVQTRTLAHVWFKMLAPTGPGSLVSLRVDSLKNQGLASLLFNHRTAPVDVCFADTYWGDVTGERAVNSRDALIVLTAAVGLPTSSFDIPAGDVDGDAVVTSRDALLILGHSIRVFTGYYRLGTGRPQRCGPLQAAPHDLLFFRNGALFGVNAADTVPAAVTLPVAPALGYPAVWSPAAAGTPARILYTGLVTSPTYGFEVLAWNSVTGAVDTLTRNPAGDVGADWSPNGARVAFLSSRATPPAVFAMNNDGSLQTQLTTTVTVNLNERVSWNPVETADSGRVAFVADSGACCTFGIWVVKANGNGLTEVLGGETNLLPRDLAWNARGDSILYRSDASQAVFAIPALPRATGVMVSRLSGETRSPASAGTTGAAFQSLVRVIPEFYVLRADGRHFRLLRFAGTTDQQFVFRRP